MSPQRLLVFAGSTRDGSLNRALASNAATAAIELDLQPTLLDLRRYPLPLYERTRELATGVPRNVMSVRAQMRSHPMWLIASPEHNRSVPALLKNVIDWGSRPIGNEGRFGCFKNSVIGLMSASDDGGYALAHLREILTYLGARVVPQVFLLPKGGGTMFDATGVLIDPGQRAALHAFVRNVSATESLSSAEAVTPWYLRPFRSKASLPAGATAG